MEKHYRAIDVKAVRKKLAKELGISATGNRKELVKKILSSGDATDSEEDEVTENLLDTVLIPTDFSRKSLEALNVIRSLREYVGKVLFVHVVEHSRNKHDYKEKYGSAKMFLQELVDEMKIFGIEADYRIAHGVASKKIAAICERDNVSLIMMTKTGADMTNGDDLGSTSENVVLNSDCAVMLLPAEDSDEEDTFS